jgi:hypothetical protein
LSPRTESFVTGGCKTLPYTRKERVYALPLGLAGDGFFLSVVAEEEKPCIGY